MSRSALILALLTALLAVAVVCRLLVGHDAGWHWPESTEYLALRSHRVISGALVGSSLAIGGVLLQSLLRNPLAAPDLIGPAAGAGMAVMLRAYLLYLAGVVDINIAGAAANAPAALCGALGALALVYTLSQQRGFVEPVSLVLIGVIMSILMGAATMFLAHLLPDQGFQATRWMIGSLSEDTSGLTLAIVGVGVGLGLLAGVILGPWMDVAALGDDEARSIGLPLARLRLVLFVLAGLLTAGSVVLAGPVGFVGLVCPHVVRLLAGPGHRTLVLGSALAGAALVVGADAATKALSLGGGRMPIGILTALIGGPVFIVLLRRDRAA